MWEIFEVKTKEEAELLIHGLNMTINDSNDFREYNNLDRINDRKICEDLIERLS